MILHAPLALLVALFAYSLATAAPRADLTVVETAPSMAVALVTLR